MAKQLLTLLTVLAVSFSVQAQTNFKLLQTGYVGALRPEAANDWTKGWANFDPVNAVYSAVTDTIALNGMLSTLAKPGIKDITSTLTLDATKVYLLKGIIVVRSGGKLVIPAGTVIRGESNLSSSPRNYAVIIVERGGQIEVLGTKDKPVVMTSNKAAGARERGDWGGLAICGRATNNQASGEFQLEGFNTIPIELDATLGKGGGTNDDDNSGKLNYLRIEFAGLAFQADREVNSLTLASVGRATEIKYVQCSHGNDDAFEWFGGTVNGSYLIAWKTTDDDFDADFGYRGLNQFGLGVKDKAFYDLTYSISGGSTSEGFEIDNDGSGSGATPKTSAIFSNFTMVGPIALGTTYDALTTIEKAAFRRGARIRRNASARIVNSIFMGYRNMVMIDGDSCIVNTNFPAALTAVGRTAVPQANELQFYNNLICNTAATISTAGGTTANGLVEVAAATRLAVVNDYLRQTGNLANKIDPVAFTAGTLLVNPLATAAGDFRPISGSPALSGANFTQNPVLANLFLLNNTQEWATNEKPVFPNPITKGDLMFGRQVVSYGIFDISGRLVQHGFETDRASVNNLAKGVYIIKLEGKAQKFVVSE
jgi:Secretion system C-terminal sorting domain